jgi:hypothetical protein
VALFIGIIGVGVGSNPAVMKVLADVSYRVWPGPLGPDIQVKGGIFRGAAGSHGSIDAVRMGTAQVVIMVDLGSVAIVA